MDTLRKMLLALLSVIFLIFSFPLPDLGWFAFVSLIPIFIGLYRAKFWTGFFIGWFFGSFFVYSTTYWLGIFGWEPLVVASFYYGLFYAFFFGIYGWLTERSKNLYIHLIIPPLLWVFFEWLKTQGAFGFPWGTLGYTQYRFLALIGISTITGVYGISFILVFLNNLVAVSIRTMKGEFAPFYELSFSFLKDIKSFLNAKKVTEKDILVKVWFYFLVFFFLTLVWGRLRIPYQTGFGEYEDLDQKCLTVEVVQPNFPQEIKWKRESFKPTLDVLQSHTKKISHFKGNKLVVWPETAIPDDDPLRNLGIRHFMFENAKKNATYLLLGVIEQGGDAVFNTAILVSPWGKIVDRYEKIHLVPFGEYLPLPKRFRKYKIFDRVGDYTSGERITIFPTPGGNFSVLICFESMFDYLAREGVKRGAEFLVVITNDAWFNRTNAAKGHFIMAVFRAVENRVWLVQSSNTGISGVVDPWGHILYETSLYERTSFIKNIYPSGGGTFYTWAGNWFPVFALLFSTGWIIQDLRRRK